MTENIAAACVFSIRIEFSNILMWTVKRHQNGSVDANRFMRFLWQWKRISVDTAKIKGSLLGSGKLAVFWRPDKLISKSKTQSRRWWQKPAEWPLSGGWSLDTGLTFALWGNPAYNPPLKDNSLWPHRNTLTRVAALSHVSSRYPSEHRRLGTAREQGWKVCRFSRMLPVIVWAWPCN